MHTNDTCTYSKLYFTITLNSKHNRPSSPWEPSFSPCVSFPYPTLLEVGTMDPDFIDRLQKISLTEEEGVDIAIRVNHRKQVLEECSLSLLGRFLSDKPLNLRAAKNLLRSVWRLGNDLKVVEEGVGLLQFKFSLESQLKWVLENGPWCFDTHLLVLRWWEKGMTVINVKFSKIQLWI